MKIAVMAGQCTIMTIALSFALGGCATSGAGAQPAVPMGKVVFKADFDKVAKGLTDNKESVIKKSVVEPADINTRGYAMELSGKLKVNTAQSVPPDGTNGSWTAGAVQFSNGTDNTGTVTIKGVQCPFKLMVHHAPTNSKGTDRKLRIMFGAKQVYWAGGADESAGIMGYTASLDSAKTATACTTGKTDVTLYGWNGEKGAGVRVFDVVIAE